MLTAQTPSWSLPAPFHPLAMKPVITPASATWDRIDSSWSLAFDCHQIPGFLDPQLFLLFLSGILSLSPTQLLSSLSSDMALLLPGHTILPTWSVLLSPSSNLHFSISFDLWNPDPLQILFLREGHCLNYQSSCLIQKVLPPKVPFKIRTLCYLNGMFWKVMQYILSSDEAETLCMLSSLHLCLTKSERQKHRLISIERRPRGTSKSFSFYLYQNAYR